MIEFLNTNEGVISAIGVIVGIIIAIISYLVNDNIKKISQNQSINGKYSKGIQGGRDVVDRSINFDK